VKIFVTGATGFVGSHVARLLSEGGADLRLLVRPSSNTKLIDPLPAERVVGDLRQADALRPALQGCDSLFHVAADYRLWARDPREIFDINVNGTRGLLRAAREAGVKRVIYTSSVATMHFNGSGTPTREDMPVSEAEMIGDYKRSKFVAEQAVLEAARAGMHVVIVNPSAPMGEQDIKPTPTGRIVLDFIRGKFPAYVDTGLNVVDVVECARGHLLALEKGKAGERYILGGEDLTLKGLLDRLSAITGIPSPTRKVPHGVALAFAYCDEFFTGRLLRREPRATVDAVRMGKKKMFASSAKAERELGWKIVPVGDALRRAVEWFRANGYV
jgi:dihydroflavonol-4-reductase